MAKSKNSAVDDLLPDDHEEELENEELDEEEAEDSSSDDGDGGQDESSEEQADGERDDEGEGSEDEQEEARQRRQNRDKKSQQFRPGFKKGKPKGKDKPGQQQQPQTVPLAVLLGERNASKAELAALRAELEKLKNPPKPEDKPKEIEVPDYAKDPVGHINARHQQVLQRVEQFEKSVAGQTKKAEETAVEAAQRTEASEFQSYLERSERAFVSQQPDYMEALTHIRQVRFRQLKRMHPEAPEGQIWQHIGQEEIALARQVTAAGRNPFQTVYELAQDAGYQPKKPGKGNQSQETGLPRVNGGPRQLPPDQHLGGHGRDQDEDEDEDAGNSGGEYQDQFDVAFAELYDQSGKNRRRRA